jgi:peptidoglycan/LPS O-acetylase OafA/YrhL
VLRGLAIVSVLVLHFNIAYRLLQGPLGKLLPGPYLSNLVWNGNYGVVVFFVISGYLITSTSLRRFGSFEQVSFRGFYAFRFARIMPCLLLALAAINLLALAGIAIFKGSDKPPLWLSDLSVLTFWHNILMAKFGYFNYCLNIYWSLSVEELFYITFPLLCALLKKGRWIVPLWCVAIIVGPIYRAHHSHNEILFLYGNLACFDAIAMGCCVAVFAHKQVVQLKQITRILMQIAALLWMLYIFLRAGIDSVPVWGPTLMALGAAVFLFAEGGLTKDLKAKSNLQWIAHLQWPIAWLGQHSYELYLFHILLLAGLMTSLPRKQMPPDTRIWWMMLFIAVSCLICWAIARLYSEPLNRVLRRKLAPTVVPS